MTIVTEDTRENPKRRKVKRCLKNTCSTKMLKKRLPILGWLPKYKLEYISQDIIAGITVALTAIPQGIAYAVIAGLPPEYGLYASLTAGIVYVIFGSCHNVTVGPTAILAAMTARYVAGYSAEFAILAAFLAGVFIFLLGVFNLGFLVEFISMPVINGFTTAAAFQIAASQLKSFFGLDGISGNYFSESVHNFITNIKTAQLWDPILGLATIIMLILLKKMGEGCSRTDGMVKKSRWFLSLSRNAVVVIVGMFIGYVLKLIYGTEPISLIGNIGGGLPKFGLPPFYAQIGNQTLNFVDMVQILGLKSIILPFVAILEAVAIAKAFAEAGRIDATQEMIAIGLCNIVGSFGQSMPITGSFTRTALNHVSGVKTPAGGITNVLLLIIALTFLTDAFYFIPKPSLAGLIMMAMYSIVDLSIFAKLWRSGIKELLLLVITMAVCMFYGLEYGIVTGIIIEALLLLFNVARPSVDLEMLKSENGNMMLVNLCENVLYCSNEHVRMKIMKVTSYGDHIPIVINGVNLRKLDYTAAFNLMSMIKDLSKSHTVILLNFNKNMKKSCLSIEPGVESRFMYASNPLELTVVFPKDV